MELIATFSSLRKVIETNSAITVCGHSGVWESSDEVFSKPQHSVVMKKDIIEIYRS